MNDPIVGIDLGTTNSEVAIVEDGRVTVIGDAGLNMLPSVVGLADDGAILVGTSARNQYTLYPERTVKSIKRHMGNDEQVILGDKSYSPQEISAIILKRLKSIAEQYLGRPVDRAVITVPAYFSDAQRQATREAGEIAGFKIERMINEPTAAALAFDASEKHQRRVLVYDLGGGTFDVSVVSLQNDVVEVLASHGNNHLGGDDFDAKIVDLLVEQLQLQHQGVNLRSHPQALARLERAAEVAKISLSDEPFALIEEEFLLTQQGNPVHLSYELARDDYETLIDPFIAETFRAVHTALEGAELTTVDIDEILLVGGATRTPIIRKRLQEMFKMSPRSEINPDLCVATGAAIQAAAINGEAVSSVLIDVTPYSFGTSVLGELEGEPYPHVYIPVIEKNTALPIAKSDVFFTSIDGQESIEVNIFQGEDIDALNNIAIGQFLIEGLSDVRAGNPIVLSLTLDLDGLLMVTAMEKDTGLSKSITIDNAMSTRLDEAGMENARSRIDALFNDDSSDGSRDQFDDASDAESAANPTNRENKRQIIVQAKALVEKAERLLEEANADDREDLVDQIEMINDAITGEDYAGLKLAVDELSDLVYYLEV